MAKATADKKPATKSENKKPSPTKGEKKGSPKKGSSPKKGGNKTSEDAQKILSKVFARKRYENMDAMYKRSSNRMILLTNRVHLWERWMELPVIVQMCNSNAEVQIGGDSQPVDEEDRPCTVEGVVCVRQQDLTPELKVFVEVVAFVRYVSHGIKPEPLPPELLVEHVCFRQRLQVFPVDFSVDIPSTGLNQSLIGKCRQEYAGMNAYPFVFDLSEKPDSIKLNRPGSAPDIRSGIFWFIRGYVAANECQKPPGDDYEVSMEMWKYTYAPLFKDPNQSRSDCAGPMEYIRYKTQDDAGDLILRAQLSRDVYYLGEAVSVTIHVENGSRRHVIWSIDVFIEQTVRHYREVRQDYSIPLGEQCLTGQQYAMPINPNAKGWSKTVELKAEIDFSRHNLAFDGLMSREKKFFLASSTIIIKKVPMTEKEIQEALEKKAAGDKKGSRKNSPNKKGSPSKGSKKPSPSKNRSNSARSPGPQEMDENENAKTAKKGSPDKGGDKKKDSPKKNDKKNSPKKDSPKKGTENKEPETPQTPPPPPMKLLLRNKHRQRSIHVAYDVVVRMNLKTSDDKEAGNPSVRVPLVLTRETSRIDKWTIPSPYRPPINFYLLPERITSEPYVPKPPTPTTA